MNRLTLALVAAIAATAGHAMEKPYVGLDYQMQTHDFNGTDVSPDAFRVRLGNDMNSHFGVEVQAGIGGSSDSIVVDSVGTTWDVKTDSFYALFAKPQINLGDTLSIYGLVGGSYVDVSAKSNTGKSTNGFESDFSYGAGIDLNVHKGIRIGVDFIQYLEDVSAISAGIRIPLN